MKESSPIDLKGLCPSDYYICVKLQLRKGVPGGRRIWLKKVVGKNGQER